jgi:hypothetical protein
MGENDRYLVRGDRYVLYEVEQPHRGMYKGIHIRGGVLLHTMYVYYTNLSNMAHCHGNVHALVQPLHAWRSAGDAVITLVCMSPLQSPPPLYLGVTTLSLSLSLALNDTEPHVPSTNLRWFAPPCSMICNITFLF